VRVAVRVSMCAKAPDHRIPGVGTDPVSPGPNAVDDLLA
jgi:hypothetical protein